MNGHLGLKRKALKEMALQNVMTDKPTFPFKSSRETFKEMTGQNIMTDQPTSEQWASFLESEKDLNERNKELDDRFYATSISYDKPKQLSWVLNGFTKSFKLDVFSASSVIAQLQYTRQSVRAIGT